LDVAYVGNHGVDVGSATDLNASRVIGAGTLGQPEYPRTATTTFYYQGFSSAYHALQVKLDRRFSSGFLMTTAFTWSKAMNFNNGDDGGLMFYINPRRSYARADWDRTLGYVQSYSYQLPFGSGKKWLTSGPAAHIAGGWQISGVLTIESGTPLNITANGGSLAAPGNTQTANLVAPVQILHGINVGNPWFSPSSFAQPVGPMFGSTGRATFSGPGYIQLNLSLFKDVRIKEKYDFQLRGETFNFTNTPQFANPSNSITSQTFGQITSTVASGTGVNGIGGGRVVQLGLRITF
jgi:hypothetical protein